MTDTQRTRNRFSPAALVASTVPLFLGAATGRWLLAGIGIALLGASLAALGIRADQTPRHDGRQIPLDPDPFADIEGPAMSEYVTGLPILADAYELAEVIATPSAQRDRTARLATARQRREQRPDLRTWAPGDPALDREPETVQDGDGDTWRRDPGGHLWRMSRFDPADYEPQAGDPYPWNELLERYGPLTET